MARGSLKQSHRPRDTPMPSLVIPEILSRHAEEAAFLWLLRDRAVARPQYTLSTLTELDQRVEAHRLLESSPQP